MSKEYYDITLAGVKRSLPLFEVAPGLRIAILNILGDTELVEACADELAKMLKEAKELLGTSQEKTFHSGGGHFTLRMAETLLSHLGIFPEVEANVVQVGGIFWA